MSAQPTEKGSGSNRGMAYTFSSVQSDPGPTAIIFFKVSGGKAAAWTFAEVSNILCWRTLNLRYYFRGNGQHKTQTEDQPQQTLDVNKFH